MGKLTKAIAKKKHTTKVGGEGVQQPEKEVVVAEANKERHAQLQQKLHQDLLDSGLADNYDIVDMSTELVEDKTKKKDLTLDFLRRLNANNRLTETELTSIRSEDGFQQADPIVQRHFK